MSLYLCIFDSEEEVDGMEVGSYDDFGRFRDTVLKVLEHGRRGSRFPVLQLHSDCEGEWGPAECRSLHRELEKIDREFSKLPMWVGSSPRRVAQAPPNLADSFVDVDGDRLIDRLLDLCQLAIKQNRPILFQ